MKEVPFLRRIFSTRILPSWTILLFDISILIFSVVVAFALRFTLNEVASMGRSIRITMAIVVVVNLIFFRLFRTYSNVLRLSSFVDVMHIFVALTLGFLVTGAASLTCTWIWDWTFSPLSVLIITYVVSFLLLATSRMAIKMLNDYFNQSVKTQLNTYIYGTQSGMDIAKAVRTGVEHKFHIRGFITDEPDLAGKVMMGVNVYRNDERLIERIRQDRVDAVIVSPDKAELLKESDVADRLLQENVKIFLAPEVSDDWTGDHREARVIKEVQIEDLLGRDPIKINMKEIASLLEGKRVLITGAAGSIGSEIMRQVARFNPYQMILVDNAETPLHDIRLELRKKWREIEAPTIIANCANKARMEDIFRQYQPEYVFHAAAYKHVPMMEDNVSEAIQNNVLGAKVMADLAVKYGVSRFVMVSTDKAVNPSNVMGCSKRICEIYVQALARKLQKEGNNKTQFITTRFGNVLGSNGSVIPLFRRQIAAGGPVTVTHPEIIRYFMTIPEACQLVLEAGSMGKSGEIYIFDMGKPVKIVDLAKRMIRLSGRTDVKIEFTGLRHGEKLYEELLATRENTKPTSHDKIMIATVREYEFEDIREEIDSLIDESYLFDSMRTVAKMKDLVPEFKSLNSKYSILD
ncbi:MAG: polysaccharide biosynthesis protein [Bacteroidales bacterium]|nr:polysaccharide biosynthesis protein [Bacteroidales bacterium]